GGAGTRLHPTTRAVSKQLLPVYDKPLIYYPLSLLMLSGVRDILIITTPGDQASFKRLLGDGEALGVSLTYRAQPSPEGIAQAFLIADDFIGDDCVTLVLGDNIFYGQGLIAKMQTASSTAAGASVFAYAVQDPERYGVIELDGAGNIVSIEEKPEQAKSNLALTGLYMFDSTVVDIAAGLTPSARGELEIVDVMKAYVERETLSVETLGRGIAWFDTGTPDSLLDAANFIATIERRQGQKIACLEEVAWRHGWIDHGQLETLAQNYGANAYGDYLRSLV
ncbi:MAG: glucose-1-phosphate thymidylyltransferase RfbA, partial [Alphaproteobacteria bacterium]|nr:glucose-1-phosphate thymidylyltransferase RfbA [Alphaproteobacteria bacterium]